MTSQAESTFLDIMRFVGQQGLWESVIWNADLRVSVNVSDVFYWGCADAEEVTADNFHVLRDAAADLAAIHPAAVLWATELFATRVRNERPQGAFVNLVSGPTDEDTRSLRALFLRPSPRDVGLGNPYEVEDA